MKRLTLFVVAIFSCFAYGLTEANPYDEPDIAQCSNLKDEIQIEYCKKEYANSPKRETEAALYGIFMGMSSNGFYQAAIASLKSDNLLLQQKNIESAVLYHLSSYSKRWAEAIESHSEYPDYSVEFNTALSITNKELARLGVQTTLSEIKNTLREHMAEYDGVKYPNTFQLYAVLSQMIGLAQEPRGSLQSYNQTVNSLQSDFERYYSLAELENPLPRQKAMGKPKTKAKKTQS